jgi:hypothetical protein
MKAKINNWRAKFAYRQWKDKMNNKNIYK